MDQQPPPSMDDVLGRLVEVLAGAGGTGEPSRGASSDETVSAEVGPDGRVRSLDADPRVLRRTTAELADRIVEAVNAALAAHGAGADPGAGLLAGLREVQEDSTRAMGALVREHLAPVERLEAMHR